jgi:hypothetical protein
MSRYVTVARLLELCSKAGRASSHHSRIDSARYQLRDSQRVPSSRKILVHVEVPSIRGRAHVNSMLMQLWNINPVRPADSSRLCQCHTRTGQP